MGKTAKMKISSFKEKIFKFLSLNRLIFLLSLVLVLFLSDKYLFHKKLGFEEIPNTTDVLDEMNYVWAGKSFLQTGIPTAWSNLDAYKKNGEKKVIKIKNLSLTYNGEKPSLKNVRKFDYPLVAVAEIDVGKGMEQMLMVQPFIDHSFFSGLIFGLNTPDDIKSFTEVHPEEYREIAIKVSLLTGVLIFLLAYLLYDPLTAIFSFIIYSTVSVYILVSRYALIENLLVPLTLLSLIFIALFKKPWFLKDYQKKILLILGGLSAGLSLAMKEVGIAVVLTGILLLLINKTPFKKILYFLIPAILVGSSFYLYALFIAPRLFLEVLTSNVSRGFFGPLNFIYAFYRPRFAGFPLEGYWPFGFIAILFLTKQLKENIEILIGFLLYLLVFLFWGGLNYPWYPLVFLPFTIIASGLFIRKLLIEPSPLSLIIFFLFPFSSSLHWGHNVFRSFFSNIIFYRIFILGFLVLGIFFFLRKKLPRLKVIAILILLVILWKVYQWNHYGFEYLIANWGELSEVFMWKF
ncbi:hypothetical protein AMJ51_01540 [Microgenomates bacterium DG_75]|nr:MAG: hypothetical protein AMJ51_01540 [Microgenomates bacterium DG_75]